MICPHWIYVQPLETDTKVKLKCEKTVGHSVVHAAYLKSGGSNGLVFQEDTQGSVIWYTARPDEGEESQ